MNFAQASTNAPRRKMCSVHNQAPSNGYTTSVAQNWVEFIGQTLDNCMQNKAENAGIPKKTCQTGCSLAVLNSFEDFLSWFKVDGRINKYL